MRKIIEQRLDGSEENANKEAQYTWNKDEIAYIIHNHGWIFEITKVKLTGKRWLIGNKWGRSKIYQYECIEDILGTHSKNFPISHCEEYNFYTDLRDCKIVYKSVLEHNKTEAETAYEKGIELLNSIKL